VNRTVRVSRGNVVGIGKVKIPKTQEFNYEIQLLSFLDIQESETSFIATCIHLHIDGYGKTIEEAEEDMVESVYYFLCENFRKLPYENAWDNLFDLYKSDEWSNELWNAYHEVQIHLSMKGIPTDNITSVKDKPEFSGCRCLRRNFPVIPLAEAQRRGGAELLFADIACYCREKTGPKDAERKKGEGLLVDGFSLIRAI